MKKLLIILAVVLVALIVVGGIAAILFVNSIVKKGVETVGPKIAKVEMKLEGANISIFSGAGALKGMFIGNPEGFKTASAIQVGRVAIAVEPRSVLSEKIVVHSVEVAAPEITFEGSLKGSNLSKILENVQAFTASESGAARTEGKGSSKKLQVDDFAVTGGRIHLSMTMLGGKALTVPLPDIRLRDLGKGSNGITAGELTERVFKEVFDGTVKAAGEALGKVGKEAVDAAKGVGQGAADQAGKVTKSIGELFKKKK